MSDIIKIHPYPILCVGPDQTVHACNPMGTIFLDNLTNEDRETLSKEAKKCLQNSLKIQREFSAGQQIYLATFMVDEDSVYIFTQEVSELWETKKNLKRKDEQHSTLIDTIPGFVSWINRDLKYIAVNDRLAKTYEAKPEDFVGKTVGFLGAETNPNIADTMENFFNSDLTDLQFEVEIEESSQTRYLLLNAKKFHDNSEIIIIGMDVTKQKNIKDKLREEVKKSELNEQLASLGYFQATLFHEVNNPLMVVQAQLESMHKKVNSGQNQSLFESINTSQKSVEYLLGLTKTMKKLSRLDNHMDDREVVSLEELIHDLSFLFEPLMKKYNIEFGIDNRIKGEDKIMCFPGEFSLVVINLIKNAVDAIKEMNTPFIQLIIEAKDEKNLILSIKDSGYGISKEEGEKIFNSFYTTKKSGDGTGIGLSLVKKMIEKHGGKIQLNHESANTQFDIILKKAG